VNEFCSQFDFSTFDQEVMHSKTRRCIEAADGRSPDFATLSLLHLGREVGAEHRATHAPTTAVRSRGRPRKVMKPTKRKHKCRISPWNMFVRTVKPSGKRANMGNEIKSGAHLRRLSAMWNEMSDLDKAPYARLARNRRLEVGEASSSDAEGTVELEPESVAQNAGPWSLGTERTPLSPALMVTPPDSDHIREQVAEWLKNLGTKVEHDGCLPKKVVYDDCCAQGACKNGPHYTRASTMLGILHDVLKPHSVTSVCMLAVLDDDVAVHSECFMVAHRQDCRCSGMACLVVAVLVDLNE
jgi:hypothetical protein